MNREELEFRYFFNAGFNRVTCECDVEGSDVYQNGHYVGSVKWKTPEELSELTDEELEDVFLECDILLD